MNTPKQTLILGIGNYLMGDEGVGVHAIEALLKEQFPEHVRLVDGGTGGFHLLSFFHEYDPLILIDATMDDHPIGTVRLIQPRFASDFPRTLSAHDIGLRDLIETAILSAPLPKIYLIVISIHEIRSMVTDLSLEIEQTIPKIVQIVKEILENK
ncbi:MAG: hydrogenase maturation protease [Bacteroidota bacterium]|nr:hydrogenase maturation protease [Bacteroidota bacterium]